MSASARWLSLTHAGLRLRKGEWCLAVLHDSSDTAAPDQPLACSPAPALAPAPGCSQGLQTSSSEVKGADLCVVGLQPGIANIYSSIAQSIPGAPDFYLRACGDQLEGSTFQEARRSFPDAVVSTAAASSACDTIYFGWIEPSPMPR